MYKVLITGGSRGIGAAIATALKAAGFQVLTCSRGEGADILCDVTSAEAVQRMRDEIGPMDVLINNVGSVRTAPFLKTTEADWDWHFQINVKPVYYCTSTFLPDMLLKGWGRIINIASTAGRIGRPYITAYTASKHAVVGFTRSLAKEVASKGVTINAVCPSFVDTPMLRAAAEKVAMKSGKTAEKIWNSYKRFNPQNRLVTVEEVAATVQFLIGNAAINGQAITLCGGETA